MANRFTTSAKRLIGKVPTLGLFQSGKSNLVDPPEPGPAGGQLPPPGPGTIITAQVAERWIPQVSKGITPEALASYIDQAISGDTVNLFSFFEEMEEKWPEYRIACYKHKIKGARRNPRIVAPDKPQNPALAKRKADHAVYQFGQVRNWHATAFNLLDAVGKGISVAEIDWQVGAVLGQPAVLINEMPWVNYRHLGWVWDKPQLQLFPDLRDRATSIEVPPRKFIVYQHLSKSGHASRAALARPLAWLFLIYLYAIKDWATLAETFGIDVAHAFCEPNATPEQRNKILLHLSRLAARVGVFDRGTEITLERAAASGSSHQQELVKYCAERAIEALLGSTLATQAGDKGARSLGLVQQDETEELVDWTMLLLAGTMTSGPLRWMMDFNFAEPGDNPVMELPGGNRRDLQALANVLNILVGIGVQVPEAWVHSQFDIPHPQPPPVAALAQDTGALELVLTPSRAGSADQTRTTEQGEPLVGRARRITMYDAAGNPISFDSGVEVTAKADFGRLSEQQAQAALSAVLAQAVRQGRSTGAFQKLLTPLQSLLTGDGDPAALLGKLKEARAEMKSDELDGVAREMFLLADLLGRAAAKGGANG